MGCIWIVIKVSQLSMSRQVFLPRISGWLSMAHFVSPTCDDTWNMNPRRQWYQYMGNQTMRKVRLGGWSQN